MRSKDELDKAGNEAGVTPPELERWRERYNSERSIVQLLKEMEHEYEGDWQQVRFRLVFCFDFTPKHLSRITAWRRKENEVCDDDWLTTQLEEKMSSASHLYE